MVIRETNGETSGEPEVRISPERLAGRARFRVVLRKHFKDAILAGETLIAEWARHLRVTDQYLGRQADVLKTGAQLAVGDLFALPAEERLSLLRRLVEETEADLTPPKPAKVPERLVMALARRLGTLAETVQEAVSPTSEGGEATTSGEWDRIASQLEQAETVAREGKLAARAAADVQRRGCR